ncbi:hypothetical protein [Streptomyces sp. NPDC101393]|uniref:hypothetical protein n=1 Tax=Streptomyces sp. NPDC101393 TaxID=3366141 RepID=UPI00380E6A53
MTARRPLLTAAAAGSVLLALWFVPSANATVEDDGAAEVGKRVGAPAQAGTAGDASNGEATVADATGMTGATGTDISDAGLTPQHFLADTGSPHTTPYVIGGAACLAFGAGLVSYSVRRSGGSDEPDRLPA